MTDNSATKRAIRQLAGLLDIPYAEARRRHLAKAGASTFIPHLHAQTMRQHRHRHHIPLGVTTGGEPVVFGPNGASDHLALWGPPGDQRDSMVRLALFSALAADNHVLAVDFSEDGQQFPWSIPGLRVLTTPHAALDAVLECLETRLRHLADSREPVLANSYGPVVYVFVSIADLVAAPGQWPLLMVENVESRGRCVNVRLVTFGHRKDLGHFPWHPRAGTQVLVGEMDQFERDIFFRSADVPPGDERSQEGITGDFRMDHRDASGRAIFAQPTERELLSMVRQARRSQ